MRTIALALALAGAQSLEDEQRRLHEALARVRAERPQPGPAFDAWDARYFEAQWAYGRALFRLAEARDTRELWTRVVAYYTDFIWEREDYLAALEARILIARAHQALEAWGPCFASLKAARQVDTPERRKNPDLVEIAARSMALELRYRVPRPAEHAAALREAEAWLRQFPAARDRESFVRLRLELARLLHAAGRPSDAARVLEEIRERHAGTSAGDAALELLADLLGRHAEAFAERLFEEHHFTAAAARFGRLPKSPRVWLRLGQCYTQMRRFHEAVAALEMAVAAESPDRLEAALALEKVLDHLVRLGEGGFKPRLDAHRAWIRATFDLEKTGPRTILRMADALVRDGLYAEAAELYGRIRPGQEGHPDAIHALGYCFFRMKAYERAVEAFRAYLALPSPKPRASDTAMDLAARSLLRLGNAEEALAFTQTRVPGDPVLAQWRLAHRTDALARLGRFEEAGKTLASMSDALGPSPVIHALERLAVGYEAALKEKPGPKLWGAYARTVVALSEKSFRPLRGEKLLAAADALALEATADAWALAFDLYSQYLAAHAPPEAERRGIEYRRARAAAGSGKLAKAREIVAALRAADPYHGSYRELEADLKAAQADALPRGRERAALLHEAIRAYGELSAALGQGERGEPYYRVTEKYVARLVDRDPDRARRFFLVMEKRGYGNWDDDRWGYRTRMAALKKALGHGP